VALESFFSGSGLSRVDAGGRVRLPPFVRGTMSQRSRSRRLVFAAHASDPCLTGFDPGYAPILHAELERRRLLDEAAGIDADAHFARARRRFGFSEEAQCDERGMVLLPALMRRRGGIGALALFVGTGADFEIWDPEQARETGGEDVRALAEYWLSEGKTRSETEEGE
jgi:MraZ protein